jgi:hypothetical protein
MNTSEVMALVGASLSMVIGLLLVLFHRPFARRVKRERERLGAHIGSASHPTMLLFVGLLFVAISVVILISHRSPKETATMCGPTSAACDQEEV